MLERGKLLKLAKITFHDLEALINKLKENLKDSGYLRNYTRDRIVQAYDTIFLHTSVVKKYYPLLEMEDVEPEPRRLLNALTHCYNVWYQLFYDSEELLKKYASGHENEVGKLFAGKMWRYWVEACYEPEDDPIKKTKLVINLEEAERAGKRLREICNDPEAEEKEIPNF